MRSSEVGQGERCRPSREGPTTGGPETLSGQDANEPRGEQDHYVGARGIRVSSPLASGCRACRTSPAGRWKVCGLAATAVGSGSFPRRAEGKPPAAGWCWPARILDSVQLPSGHRTRATKTHGQGQATKGPEVQTGPWASPLLPLPTSEAGLELQRVLCNAQMASALRLPGAGRQGPWRRVCADPPRLTPTPPPPWGAISAGWPRGGVRCEPQHLGCNRTRALGAQWTLRPRPDGGQRPLGRSVTGGGSWAGSRMWSMRLGEGAGAGVIVLVLSPTYCAWPCV